MKLRSLILLLIAFIFIAVDIGNICAYTQLSPSPAAITSHGQIPFTSQALLDNFNSQSFLNAWNGATGTFTKTNVVPIPVSEKCTASYSTDTPEGTGYSLKLDYNVSQAVSYDGKPTFAGYYSILKGPSGGTSLTAYKAISFYVKGYTGGEFFKVQLKNSSADNIYYASESYLGANDATHYSRNIASVYITDYLDGGVTTTWQKVTIPFDNFANLDAWNSMLEFVIVFENAQSVTNGSSTSGTIYIDNITFETTDVTTVRVDHFGDKVGTCALGGNIGTMADVTPPSQRISMGFLNTAGTYSPNPYGLGLRYIVGSNGWAGAYIIFGGGNTITTGASPSEHPERGGWIAVSHDFSAYDHLTLKIKAKAPIGGVGQNPKVMKLEAVDAAGVKSVPLISISDTVWQSYVVYLVSAAGKPGFTGLDKTTLKQINFVLEGSAITTAGGNTDGTVYIDSIQFEK